MSALLRLLLLSCLGAFASASAATFEFRFMDGAGEGFNDPTPFTPVGGNNATTLGQARRNMLMEAGRVWGALLTSNVPIIVQASFNPQECTAMTGTLASAGAQTFFRDFSGSGDANTFFASALADSLANTNLMAQTDNPNNPDIRVTFNVSVDSNPECLRGSTPRGPGFYYGFDHNRGPRIDALVVALHELAHGFGFASEIDLDDGTGFDSNDGVARFSTYVMKIFDEQLARAWPMLSPAERIASATRTGALAWDGATVNAQTALFNQATSVTGQGRLRLNAPAEVSQGSSVSHWDSTVSRNILMEPNISGDLVNSFVDVTTCALQDIRWGITAGSCPHNPPARGLPPTTGPQPANTTAEDTPRSIQLNAVDPEGAPLIFAIRARPTRGVISGVPGNVIYTPAANATGSDSFVFAASDGTNISALTTVTINITPVNDAPTATSITVNTPTGQPVAVTLMGTDVEGQALTFSIANNPRSGTISGNSPAVTYQPNAGFAGTDTFTYVASDGTASSTQATVTVNVLGAAPTPMPTPTPTTPAPGGRGGGGGAMNELLLLALGLLALAARMYKLRATPVHLR